MNRAEQVDDQQCVLLKCCNEADEPPAASASFMRFLNGWWQ